MDQIEKLKDELLELPRKQQDEILSALAYANRKADLVLTADEQRILDALGEVCKMRVGPNFVGDYGAKKFREQCELLLQFVSETRRLLRPVQVAGLIRLCVRSLASEVQSWGNQPVTPKTVLNVMTHLRSAVDRRYPGYASAGQLHRLVNPAEAE